jgi:8-hydroxy-5-deazaflavin:NADPH oxidoreductase
MQKKLRRNSMRDLRKVGREAAHDADAVLLAVHWLRVDDVLGQAGDLSGKVIVTCSLPMDVGNTELVIGHTSSGTEELAKKVPKARIVCAFNSRC